METRYELAQGAVQKCFLFSVCQIFTRCFSALCYIPFTLKGCELFYATGACWASCMLHNAMHQLFYFYDMVSLVDFALNWRKNIFQVHSIARKMKKIYAGDCSLSHFNILVILILDHFYVVIFFIFHYA